MYRKLTELDQNWRFLKCGHSFRENWVFWFNPSLNFSIKIKSMWVTCESSDPLSWRVDHCWFWGIRISILRYGNYLQPGLHRDKYRTLAVKNFRSEAWLLTRFRAVRYWHTNQYTPTAIYLLKVITATSEKPSYDILRCCVDFKQTNTCWENATYFFIAFIK